MATAEAKPVSAEVANECPKCGKPLTDAAGLGWCPACGYCRSLEEAPKGEKKETPLSPLMEPSTPAKQLSEREIPLWVLGLVLGMAFLAGVSYYAGKQLTALPFERALWTSLQIAGGIGILFLGQFVALVRIAPEDGKLGFKDAIIPFRLYGLIFKRLPQTRFSVWTLGWGLTAIVAALVFIGGLGHWFTYIKSNKDRNNTVGAAR